jgi:hypothetical protein
MSRRTGTPASRPTLTRAPVDTRAWITGTRRWAKLNSTVMPPGSVHPG